MITDLLILLAALGAIACFAYAGWLKAQRPKWDGCIYKPPGFHGERRKRK
jgi:hypothetical protein